jgi:hypothetical protein
MHSETRVMMMMMMMSREICLQVRNAPVVVANGKVDLKCITPNMCKWLVDQLVEDNIGCRHTLSV